MWYNGNEIKIDIDIYKGDGNKPMNIGIKHLKLSNNCILKDWNVSLLEKLESLYIGRDSFRSVTTFLISGLNRLRKIKIRRGSFSSYNRYPENDRSRSFHILNCESLESVYIGDCSFSDFAGQFELKNLPKLLSIIIGHSNNDSHNFHFSSFVIGGFDEIENVMIRSS